MSLGFCIPISILGKSGLLCGDVAPLLDDGLLDLPGVGPGPGADLLGHVDALLGGLELGHQLGHVLASPLRLEGALLLGGVLDDSLHLVEALFSSLLEATASRGTELPGLLGAAGDRGVLLHRLLRDRAHLLGPLGALGVGGVAAGVVLALLFDLGLAGDHVVLHVVHLLLGPALGLVLGPADLRALHVAVLHQGGPADGGGLVEGDLLVLDETVLPEVLLAVLLLLRLVVGGVGGVAPPVVGVVALHHVVVLGLLHHLHLVDAPLAIRTRSSSSNRRGAHVHISSLPLIPAHQLRGLPMVAGVVSMVSMVLLTSSLLVEGERVGQGTLVPRNVSLNRRAPRAGLDT